MLPFKVSCGSLFRFDGWGYKALTDFRITPLQPKVGAEDIVYALKTPHLKISKGDVLYVNERAGTFIYQGKTYGDPSPDWVKAAVRDNLIVPVLSKANLLGTAKHEPRVNKFLAGGCPRKVPVKHDVDIEAVMTALHYRPNLEAELDKFSEDIQRDLDWLDADSPIESWEDKDQAIQNPEFWAPPGETHAQMLWANQEIWHMGEGDPQEPEEEETSQEAETPQEPASP